MSTRHFLPWGTALLTLAAVGTASALVAPAPRGPPRHARQESEERDDPGARGLALRRRDGKVSPAAAIARREIARREAARWAELLPGSRRDAKPVQGASWINVGPAPLLGGDGLTQPEAGRVTGVAVDPRDPNVVYVSTAAGGLWKSYDFEDAAPDPTWLPAGDGLPNLAVGAMAMDPTNPDVLYLALGDPYGSPGNEIVKTTDGGATWSAPVVLQGVAAGGLPVTPLSARDLKVDPANAAIVLVATDVGLFRSTDGGQSFALVDLPNGTAAVAEAVWSLAPMGSAGGQSAWVASGVIACDAGWLPPWSGWGTVAGKTSWMKDPVYGSVCTLGNVGDLWRSTDSGATWTSAGASGALPALSGVRGRITVAAATAADPSSTVAYAFVANADEAASRTLGFLRSVNGGQSWQVMGGTLANPTTDNECNDLNVGHGQSGYNQAISVDPVHPERLLVAGNTCALRTLDALSPSPVWENVSGWWAPFPVAQGSLPYVHADWHLIVSVRTAAGVRVFSANDGGIYSSIDVFQPGVVPGAVNWTPHHRGMSTVEAYVVGSGDPVDGNPEAMVVGAQDLGTGLHRPQSQGLFDYVCCGDGVGAAVNKGTSGEWYWATSQNDAPWYCRPPANCSSWQGWSQAGPTPPSGDSFPFFIVLSPILTDPTGAAFLMHTSQYVWKSDATPQWTQISPAFPDGITTVFASPTVPKLYGIALWNTFAVTSDEATWTKSNPLGVGSAPDQQLTYLSSIAFPPAPPAGTTAGDVYVVASSAWMTEGETPVPDSLGHLFITRDRGQTFAPLHGDGSGPALPNVPVRVVRYDSGDATGQTLYAGTDLGLYRSTNGGRTWPRYGSGLPLVEVDDLFISKNQSLLRVATYGRGIWEIYPSSQAPAGVAGDGDFDQNLRIDWADVAALASRMGTTPATSSWPAYSWIDDLAAGTPAVAAIDDLDLQALLAKFGGHP